ncbi:MAG: serine/threonine-protein kinase, partial [Phycisphaeraceae bacterium]
MVSNETTSSDGTLLGRIIVERGLVTADEMASSLEQWRNIAPEARGSLTDWLVEHGVVTQGQITELNRQLAAQKHEGQIPGYRILDRIGAGAMASVFKAQQLSLDRTVAIKILPRRHISDASFVQRFYAEGRAAARLNHPNIVQAIDVGQSGDHHYFVMEMVEGHTVFDHLQKYHRYDEAEALRIIIQTAEALHHAHEKGFIHRDVKPKNIMITPEGTAKLADMGLARQVSDREAAEREAGRAFGTPYYISPEQIRGQVDIDSRCDIYGLGATFYHMVTG